MPPVLTKREILSAIGAIYDPLRLCGPVTTAAKIITQKIWKATAEEKQLVKVLSILEVINNPFSPNDKAQAATKSLIEKIYTAAVSTKSGQQQHKKSSWDACLSDELLVTWNTFSKQLPELRSIVIPRFYFTNMPTEIELHGFCGASEKAFGAAIYIRGLSPDNLPSVQLVISKSRVAPIKKQTLPRLKLCGAVLLAELAYKVRAMFKLEYYVSLVRLWCDSMIALSWIHTASDKLEPFIGNRVQKVEVNSRVGIIVRI